MRLNEVHSLEKPIFQDVPDGINGDWNFGVIVGGMASSDVLIARAYKQAGDILVEEALKGGEPHEVAYPIFFLYRHAVEKYLKLIVQPAKPSHKLDTLLHRFEALIQKRYDHVLPQWVKSRVLDLHAIDPGSFSFRYAKDKQGGLSVPSEWWVELHHLRNVVDKLTEGFEKLCPPS